MKTLIYSANKALAIQAKTWLDDFGHGLHTFAADATDAEAVQHERWSYAIFIGHAPDFSVQATHTKTLALTPDATEFKRVLWAIYRDELADMIGGRCSCGLHEVCHCH